MGCKLTISASGVVKVDSQIRSEVFWDEQTPPTLVSIPIVSVTDEWVKYGQGKNDKFRNPRVDGGFIINSTELRGVNFSMEPLDKPPVKLRSSGRHAALVKAPLPKRYRMDQHIDKEIRGRCW